jgi:hypothetical protein
VAAGGLAATLWGLAGCTDGSPDRPSTAASAQPSSSPTDQPTEALPRLRRNPDHDLVVASLAVELRHLDRLRAVRRRHRRFRGALAQPMAVHLAHVDVLRGAVADAPTPTTEPWPVPRTPAAALAALVASARAVSREQVDVAMRARSGTFARLAAGMAAAAAQQEQTLGELGPRRGGGGG